MKTVSVSKRWLALVMAVVMLCTVLLTSWPLMAAQVANTNELSAKTAIFFGDSIAYGYRDTVAGQGWSYRLQQNYAMTVTQKAVSGASFTSIANRNHIPTLIQEAGSGSYDYVILQGGFNDAMGQNAKPAPEDTAAPVGTISNTFFPDDFDATTFAGELEKSFYYIKKQYPNAKVGYIITYQTPHSEYGGVTAKADEMRKYWGIAKQICDKWDVQYLDLYDGETVDGQHYSNDILDMDNAASACVPGNGDHIHLNGTGYDRITDHIAQWMVGLDVPQVNAWSCGYNSPYYKWDEKYTAPGTADTSKNYASISSTYHTGDYSLKMQSGDKWPDVNNRAQTLLRDDNGNLIEIKDRTKDYVISFWVRMSGETAGSMRYYLALDNGDDSFTTNDKNTYKLFETNSTTIEKDTWVKCTHVFTGMALQTLPADATYIRLGLCSTEQQEKHEFWIDDVQVSQFGMTGAATDYEQYAAGTDKVPGNGSGREISSTHAHGGNGKDVPGQKSVRLKMNQNIDSTYARTLVQTAAGDNFQVVAGLQYYVNFWAYWAQDEGASGYTDTLPVTFCGGTVSAGYSNYNGIKDIMAKDNKTPVTLKANKWQQVTMIVVPEKNSACSTAYLTLGAKFPEAAPGREGYLYVDDVSVNLLSAFPLTNAVEAPNGALLYTDGSHATYYNIAKDTEYAAMRVMGRYQANPGEAGVAYVNGMALPVVSRGILLGDSNATDASLRVDGSYLAKTETYSDKLDSYWEYRNGKISYTLLLKNIPQSKSQVPYAYRTFLTVNVGGEQMVVYSDVVKNLSAQAVYNGVAANNPALKWFGNANGSTDDSGDTSEYISLLDDFDSRYSIVYAAGDSYAKDAAMELQEKLVKLLGGKKIVSCAADNVAPNSPYEILVGNTNRSEDDSAASELAAITEEQHDAAFAVKMHNKKVAIAARKVNDDNVKYGLVLGFAADHFVDLVSDTLQIPTSLNYKSTDRYYASADHRVFTTDQYNDLMNNAWIIVEKYPSYMVMQAAYDLQQYLATHTGEYVPIMKNEDHNNATSIYLGPQQGAVKVHYATNDSGVVGPYKPEANGNSGVDDGAYDLSPEAKKGYVDTQQTDSALLKTDDMGDFEISTGNGWPAKLTINGGSVYAVNAAVQQLIALLDSNPDISGKQTGNYKDIGDYSLSDGYDITYEENFDYTSAAEVLENYTVDKDWAIGPTEVDPNVVGEGNYMKENGKDRYWDVQARPAQWGIDGTYYAQNGYLFEYTRKSSNGYWSVRVTTQNKMTYRYGFTEFRMVPSTDNGSCASIWAVTDSDPGAEIDVFENFGKDQLIVNMHYWNDGVGKSLDHVPAYKDAKELSMTDGSHFYDTFHYIGFEWDADAITYYIDGEPRLKVDISNTMYDLDGNVHIPESAMEVFRRPIWIKFTNGVGGGHYTGNAAWNNGSRSRDPEDFSKGNDLYHAPTNGKYSLDSVDDFCETQVIDYFYIFQKKDNGSLLTRQ